MAVKKKKGKKKEIKHKVKKTIKTTHKQVIKTDGYDKNKTYWSYFSLVMFLVFAVLFIAVLIIAMFAIFGGKGVWLVIPVTVVLWGISFLIAKILFKKKKK